MTKCTFSLSTSLNSTDSSYKPQVLEILLYWNIQNAYKVKLQPSIFFFLGWEEALGPKTGCDYRCCRT